MALGRTTDGGGAKGFHFRYETISADGKRGSELQLLQNHIQSNRYRHNSKLFQVTLITCTEICF